MQARRIMVPVMTIRAPLVALALLTGLAFAQGRVGDNPPGTNSAPVPIRTANPEYTEEARNAKIEGAVLIEAVIDENGIPTEPKVVRTLDKGLDQKALEAVRQWRFKPGLKDGTPVAVSVTIEINFRLLSNPVRRRPAN